MIERHTGHAAYGETRKRRKVCPSAVKAGLALIATYGLKPVAFKDRAFLQFVESGAAYSSLSTCNGFWPRMRKLAAQPVTVASTAVPTSAIAVASHST